MGRNVFDARPDVDMEVLATITSYTRRVVHGLDKVDDRVLYSARITFGLPNEEAETVKVESKLIETLPETPSVDRKAT